MKYRWRLSEKSCGYWWGHHRVIHTNIAAVYALLALDVRAKIPGHAGFTRRSARKLETGIVHTGAPNFSRITRHTGDSAQQFNPLKSLQLS
jgi:hypothetical protein